MEYLEYDFAKEDPFRNYEKEIDNLDFNKTADGENEIEAGNRLSPEMCAMLRNALHEIRNAVTKVGSTVLKVGLRALNFIFKAIEMFPNTACGLLIIACIHGIARSIPFFGHVLDAFMVPIDAIIITSSFIKDFLGSDMFKKMMASLEKSVAAAAAI